MITIGFLADHLDSIPIFISLTAVSLLSNCTTAPSPTPTTIPTGIAYVDEVIEAVQTGDPQVLKSLFVLSTLPCTTEKWLLRQPLCADGETEGALVQTMPMLSSDLGHLRTNEIRAWQGIGEAQLYAVYRTGAYTYADELFPLGGEYAIAFIPECSDFAFILQVTRDARSSTAAHTFLLEVILALEVCPLLPGGNLLAFLFIEH
jgi:hypothetical protein